MATYKVLQDIEAEDKLVGPLTLKQFIFGAITLLLIFIEFKIATAGALGVVRWPFVIVILIPLLIFGFLAAPIGRDQPNDVWLLARLRFYILPHTRIWNQDGISQLVTITVPKKIEKVYTDGLSKLEVTSRLQALANTLDSRGWAVKNVSVNMFAQPGYLMNNSNSDRLVAASSLPQDTPVTDVRPADDIMDPANNPVAHQLDSMIQASAQAHRQQVTSQAQNSGQAGVSQQSPAPDYWFIQNQPNPQNTAGLPPDLAVFRNTPVVRPGSEDAIAAGQPTAAEVEFMRQHEHDISPHGPWNKHIKTIQPLSANGAKSEPPKSQPSTPQNNYQASSAPHASFIADRTPQLASGSAALYTPPSGQKSGTSAPNPAILGLAKNDDLNVATIARQANKIASSVDQNGEVVISLH